MNQPHLGHGLANVGEYRELVERDLRDLLGVGVELVEEPTKRIYSRPNPRAICLQLPGDTHHLRFQRPLAFSAQETSLLQAYVEALHEFGRVPRVFATTASEDVLTRAIAASSTSSPEQARTLETVMQAVVRYATRTYEGVRVAVNLCIDLHDDASGLPFSIFLDQSWAPVLGSGLNTAIQLTSDGSIGTILDLDSTDNADTILAPENFTRLAEWTRTQGRIGMSVTRSGEVYFFAAGQLQFARRNARWQGFPLTLLGNAGWFGTSKRQMARELKRDVLTSLLDASAAHHGACLGVIVLDQVAKVLQLINPEDAWESDANVRRRLFGQAQTFGSLSRRRRLELLSMDGATLIDQRGAILAGGAILRVPGGDRKSVV